MVIGMDRWSMTFFVEIYAVSELQQHLTKTLEPFTCHGNVYLGGTEW